MTIFVYLTIKSDTGQHSQFLRCFSPQAQFLVQLFSTQKRVNRDKTDFATKQHKLRQNRYCNKRMVVCSCGEVCHVETFLHMTDFSTFLRITHFAPNLSCGELSLCDRFSHVEKLLHMTICGACDKYQVWS